MHDVQHLQARVQRHQQRRDHREVLRQVVGDGERGQAAAGHEQLLADAHDLDELGGRGIQVHHVARLLGRLGAGVHGHGHIGLGQGRRVVGAVTGHGHEVPLGLVAANGRQLRLGGGLGDEVVQPRLGGDGRGRERVVAGDHDGLDAHGAQVGEVLADARLDDVLQMDDPEHLPVPGHHERGAAGPGHPVGDGRGLGAVAAPALLHVGPHGIGGPLANLVAAEVHPAHARLGREGHHGEARSGQGALADAEALLGEHHHRAALGGLVGQARQLGGVGQVALAGAVHGQEGRGLAVAQSDGAGLVQQQHVHIAGRLHGPTARGQHVGPVQTTHAGNADGRQQRADGGGRQAHEQGHKRGESHGIRLAGLGGRERPESVQGHRHGQEHQGERDEQQL